MARSLARAATLLLLHLVATIAPSSAWPRYEPSRRSLVGRAVQAARERGESEAVAMDRALQAASPQPPLRSGSCGGDDGTIDIADYNANSLGQSDVSRIIDEIAVAFPPVPGSTGPTRTLLCPPGLYLINPPANVTTGGSRLNGGYYYMPTHLTLKFAAGAMLLSGKPMLRTLIGGTIEAGYTQQIFAASPQQPNIGITTTGTTAHVHLGCAPGTPCTPHGFLVGDRFFISGSSRGGLNGGHVVTAVKDVYDFEFMLLHEPTNSTEAGKPSLSIASWYFLWEAYPGQNLFRAQVGHQQWVTPQWWGAKGSVVLGDSTVGVQSAIDSCAGGVMLLGTYKVTRVSIEGSGRVIEGHGGGLSPMDNARPNPLQLVPAGTLNAVLEIKCDYSEIRNLAVVGAYNGTYTAAVHWYSNNQGIWYVGFNRITNLHIAYAKIGLLVGAAPNQDPKYFAPGYAGGTAPDGTAINCALSESYIDGLSLRGTEKGFYMNQPNGVLHMMNSFLYASSQDWPGPPGQVDLPGYDWNEACPLELHGSFSIQVESCDLEVNQNGEWTVGGAGIRIANVTGAGKLSIKDTCVEMQGSFHIGGDAAVSWDGNTDGYSSSPFPTFEIAGDATGSLLLSNVAWVRPTGWGNNMPVQFVSRQISKAHPDSLFRVTLDAVQLHDFNFDVWSAPFAPVLPDPPPARPPPPPSGYAPVTRGVRTDIRDLTILHSLCTNDPNTTTADVFCGHGKRVEASVAVIRPSSVNLLRSGSRGAIDVSAASIPLSVPADHDFTAAPMGGWLVNISTGGASSSTFHGLDTAELPRLSYIGQPPADTAFQRTKAPFRWPSVVRRGMRLTAGAAAGGGGAVRITVPGGLQVAPATNYVLSGWIRTNGVGTVTIHTQWLSFDGQPTTPDTHCSTEHASGATVCGARVSLPMQSEWLGFHEATPLWEPLLVRLESSWDAAYLRLGFEASAGAQLDLCDLGLY